MGFERSFNDLDSAGERSKDKRRDRLPDRACRKV